MAKKKKRDQKRNQEEIKYYTLALAVAILANVVGDFISHWLGL